MEHPSTCPMCRFSKATGILDIIFSGVFFSTCISGLNITSSGCVHGLVERKIERKPAIFPLDMDENGAVL